MELVSNWYMREPDERRRSTAGVPRLYQKYIGHDNNRDFYMMNQPESENANRMMYREWFPAIMYNHHQTGPAGRGAVRAAVPRSVQLPLRSADPARHRHWSARRSTRGSPSKDKPGAVMRSAASYSTWFNGGIRTTSYFHNQIGILTEMIGNPTPIEIPFVPEMQLPRADVPNPIAPQPWHFRQSIEYSMTTNYAILDIASRAQGRLPLQHVQDGRRTRSTRATATTGRCIRSASTRCGPRLPGGGRSGRGGAPVAIYNDVLRDPAARDPRGFILPSDQPDFLTATKFVNILIKARCDACTAPRRRSPSAGSSIRPVRTSSRRRRRSART